MPDYTSFPHGNGQNIATYNGHISRDEFSKYFDNLKLEDNYPGIQGVGFVLLVPLALKERHIAAMRGENFPDFSIFPEGRREFYTSVIFIEPLNEHNRRAIGYDMYSDLEIPQPGDAAPGMRRDAMERARDTDQAALSGKVRLLMEIDRRIQAGTLMYLPIYKPDAAHDTLATRRANLIGWVYAPFRMENLMRGILGNHTAELDVEIYDGEEMSANTLMHDSDNSGGGETHPSLQTVRHLKVAGRTWTVSIKSLPSFEATLERSKPKIVATAGIGIGLLLTLLIGLTVRAAKMMKDSQGKLQTIIDTALDAVVQMDSQGVITDWNAQAAHIFGWSRTEAVGRLLHETIIPPQFREAHLHGLSRFLASGKGPILNIRIEVSALHRDGHEFPIELAITSIKIKGGYGFSSFIRDITQRKSHEEQLQLAHNVYEAGSEAMLVTDAAGLILAVNPAFTKITGYAPEEVIGRNPCLLSSGRNTPAFYQEMWRSLNTTDRWQGEIWNKRKDGEVYAEWLAINNLRDPDGEVFRRVALFSDITALKKHQSQLEYVSHYDPLTGLPNRTLLADRLKQAIVQAHRRKSLMALVYLDLDGFKAINDDYGHEIGDELLIALSQKLKSSLREGDTLARLGGDEFVAVLTDLSGTEECEVVLSRLLQGAAASFHVKANTLQVSASLGVTLYPLDGSDADTLLRHADQAMHLAKQAGKNRYHLFDPEHDLQSQAHREILQRLTLALERREFVLYYQPKVHMRSGKVVGAEALIRWQHPEQGLLPPGAFLPAIENSELISQVGDWVLDAALDQMTAWRGEGLDIKVSVNISAHHLQQDSFLPRLREKLDAHPDVPGDCLELEVLETAAMEDISRISQVMEDCEALGVSFSLDDFGTGYSSLTYLKRLPAKVLKIDQSFVRNMLWDAEDLAIVEGIIGLAVAFRRSVIAEGVETAEHGRLLLRLGCDLAQGYGIARPMPAQALPGWVAHWQPEPAWVACCDRVASREELPLVYAEVDHRSWLRTLENYLGGTADAPPPIDARQCRFGIWYHGEGGIHYGHLPEFQVINPLHEQVHMLGQAIITLQTAGRIEEARAYLTKLNMLHDELIGHLHGLSAAMCKAY